jgi:hypothetical protein
VPERSAPAAAPEPRGTLHGDARSRRYLGALGLVLAAAVIIALVIRAPGGGRGPAPGTRLPPFAVPLALGNVSGGANFATGPNQGEAGRRPACTVRGPGILNLCQLYERGPVVLALFVATSGCPHLAGELQALAPSFPGVAFAAVAIRGERAQLRRLIASEHLTLPLGFDSAGVLAPLYQVVTCGQVNFAYPGGVVQSRALPTPPPPATLRARVRELVAAAEARGWRRPTRPPAGAG